MIQRSHREEIVTKADVINGRPNTIMIQIESNLAVNSSWSEKNLCLNWPNIVKG